MKILLLTALCVAHLSVAVMAFGIEQCIGLNAFSCEQCASEDPCEARVVVACGTYIHCEQNFGQDTNEFWPCIATAPLINCDPVSQALLDEKARIEQWFDNSDDAESETDD